MVCVHAVSHRCSHDDERSRRRTGTEAAVVLGQGIAEVDSRCTAVVADSRPAAGCGSLGPDSTTCPPAVSARVEEMACLCVRWRRSAGC
jgi:hypothetical protein